MNKNDPSAKLIATASLLFYPALVIGDLLSYKGKSYELNTKLTASIQQGETVAVGVENEAETNTNADYTARVNNQWLLGNGTFVGLRIEYDSGDHADKDLQRDEVYAYFSWQYGRVEIGEQDGPADVLAFHAPVIGLGQIRGEFGRYAGSLALLSPFDTSDDLKAIYLSPPLGGMRFGVSWAPRYQRNENNSNPRRRTIQNDAAELAVQYQTPALGWIAGMSMSYVFSDAAPETEREDIKSWSIGTQWRRDRLIIAGAYVSRGNSNRRNTDYDQYEINAGIAWHDKKWGVSMSTARTRANGRDNKLLGAGMYYEIYSWLTLSMDLVHFDEKRSSSNENGFVGVAELVVSI